jgi:hypothetical protein
MINRTDIVQQTKEWHEVKHGKIGGTLSKGLHVKGDTLLIEILSQRIEEFDEDELDQGYESAAMMRGNDLEPLAIQYMEEYTGYTFTQTGWLQSEENELLGISPDAITENLRAAIEAKCPSAKKHTETLINNEIPLEHIDQLVHFFTVCDELEELFFISFRPEAPKHFIKRLTRESLVNSGTKARPVMIAIQDYVNLKKSKAKDLLNLIIEKEATINF